MTGRSLNVFDECAVRYVYLSPQAEEGTSSPRGDSTIYTSGTKANSQETPAEISKIGAISKVTILVENVIL